jgi:hypothetical protein
VYLPNALAASDIDLAMKLTQWKVTLLSLYLTALTPAFLWVPRWYIHDHIQYVPSKLTLCSIAHIIIVNKNCRQICMGKWYMYACRSILWHFILKKMYRNFETVRKTSKASKFRVKCRKCRNSAENFENYEIPRKMTKSLKFRGKHRKRRNSAENFENFEILCREWVIRQF